jgi:hypothetical protein
MTTKKILIFGDSFISPFTLIKDKRYIITKFKGGTLKGIIKPNNINHKKMQNIINKHKNNIKGIIFFFGSVDIHFSYYYNNLNNKPQNNSISNIKKTINTYKDMISNIQLKLSNKVKITVINPFINPVEKSFKLVIYQLLSYHIITHKDLSINNMKKINYLIKNANEFFFIYSKLMQNIFTNKKNLNNSKINIIYINFNKETINNINNSKKAILKSEYKDYSQINIHLLFKPTLILFLNKILFRVYNIKYSQNQINYFLKNEGEYIKRKKEEIKKLLNRNNQEKQAMFTNKEGQIDFYTAEKKINNFYNTYLAKNNILNNKTKLNKTNKKLSFNKNKKTKKIYTKKL